ncbi:hypothetical protein DM02DRAFT_633086 [Periconia macrospinosa]|uniref:Uncharacterized protein n=1 Tax=Periconia macrospinosa TaxID=97972 RepID=A0A2V1DAL8_9PLEO|nr:hypothetical protein DM02DRAFT_633086 [Periconia macrospinosa]
MVVMRSLLALPAAIAAVTAQISSPSRPSSSLSDESQPTATQSASGPIDTAKACGTISRLITGSRSTSASVTAELAHACLSSIPISKNEASQTIAAIKQMIQFQSSLAYLKNPPSGYWNEKVDIISGLDDIDKKVKSGTYNNEYDFETDISSLLVKAHDGHLSFVGAAFGGMFKWRRNRQIALISASKDGKETPKVWVLNDFNHTSSDNINRSPVKSINGKDVFEFLRDESRLTTYHDPDTQYNSMFYLQPADNYGYFANPRFYPGPYTNITFENGTANSYQNTASTTTRSAWIDIDDGEDAYKQFIVPKNSSSRRTRDTSSSSPPSPNLLQTEETHDRIPHQLLTPRDPDLQRRSSLPTGYSKDVIVQHSSDDVPLAGFFIPGPNNSKIGVLIIQTFNTEGADDARQFQSVVQTYISTSQAQNVTKHIIDVRTNGGGKILLGYDTYLQFFPSKKPRLQSRYRGHSASEIFGEKLSSIPRMTNANGELYTSPFNFHSYLNKDEVAFASWENMYPPTTFNGDKFTELLRYNLSDPFTTSSDRFSIGVEMTGYGSRSNFTSDPFSADDIYILTDGVCASTCALFTELMTQQGNVRTIAVGGRPSSTGGTTMQNVGGTKGSLVLQSTYLTAISAYVTANYATSSSIATDWANFLPQPFAITAVDASVNFQDNIRRGMEKDGIPTQFMNDTANCRVWFEGEMYVDPAKLWGKVGKVAFGGKDGGLDEAGCVEGSVTRRVQSGNQGAGSGNGNSGGGNGDGKKDDKEGAAVDGVAKTLRAAWFAVGVSLGVVVLGSAVVW